MSITIKNKLNMEGLIILNEKNILIRVLVVQIHEVIVADFN